jgi:hypothetical protein
MDKKSGRNEIELVRKSHPHPHMQVKFHNHTHRIMGAHRVCKNG